MSTNLPPNWLEYTDPSTGQAYYVNTLTNQSQWEVPSVATNQKARRQLANQQAQAYYGAPQQPQQAQPQQLFTPGGGAGVGGGAPTESNQPLNNLSNQFSQFDLNSKPRSTANSINLIGYQPNPNDIYDNPPPPVQLPPNASISNSPTANAHHSFKRSTLNVVPTTQSLINKLKIPLSIILTPYRSIDSGEDDIPVITDTVISRCRRCRTYINPYVTFLEGGTRWKCSICNLSNEVPQMFDWDPITNQPTDRFNRAELNHSVVEFVAPSEYMVRPPQPPVYAFLIDVSYSSIQSGMVATVARTILETLDRIPNEDGRTKVCLLAVNHALHFFNLPPNSSDPNMLVVGDLDDPFLPTPNDLLVNLSECRAAIENLLSNLSDMFISSSGPESAMGTALKAAVQLIGPFGGKIMVMTAQLPNVGQGALKNREDIKILGTTKESSLLQPQGGGFYKNLAIDCSRSQISVDMFLFGSPYQDVATLQCLPKYTSGGTYFYPGFNASRIEDALKLAHELSIVLSSPIALEAVMRVRATRGVRMSEYHGNFFVRSTDLLAMPTVPIDQSYCAEVTLEENLNVPFVVFQTAVLHTTCYGERRIRVVTLALPTSSNPAEIYASADENAIATLLANKAVERSQSSKLEDARDAVLNKLVDIFGQYKSTMTAGGGASAQLMVSENMRHLPLLLLGLLKNIGLRQSSHIPSDLRAYAQTLLTTLPTQALIPYLYPTLYSLHNMPAEAGMLSEGGLVLPPRLNLTIEKFERHGLYLIEDGQQMFLWIGRDAVPQLVLDVFNLPTLQDLRPGKITLPLLDNAMSARVNGIVNKVRESRRGPYKPHLYLVKEDGDPSLRSWALSLLVEDRFEMGLSYSQWLATLRDKINSVLDQIRHVIVIAVLLSFVDGLLLLCLGELLVLLRESSEIGERVGTKLWKDTWYEFSQLLVLSSTVNSRSVGALCAVNNWLSEVDYIAVFFEHVDLVNTWNMLHINLLQSCLNLLVISLGVWLADLFTTWCVLTALLSVRDCMCAAVHSTHLCVMQLAFSAVFVRPSCLFLVQDRMKKSPVMIFVYIYTNGSLLSLIGFLPLYRTGDVGGYSFISNSDTLPEAMLYGVVRELVTDRDIGCVAADGGSCS
ncbi:hypothetical protein E3P81_02140 [Wallemia ichthyophaga]|nr:hypothetical protein E3P97_02139 [Wallemia ichthyophaga]TIB05887.1 hypothetical protein E3P96_00800 [Wallemia ichthyophaga]TIB32787.1 hypothetical protein E3P85_01688 [Wallemia ichthyophaga]TIB46565.1 hypothetical protein E3P82_02137 [Wallemia ichthyophaga]TIB50558.1 hypothetical protein E3P81_02140 [Wallemia ichthyophaga]